MRGFVPNEMVKQRALELVRWNTFLKVMDGVKIQANLSLRPSPRVEILQKEGAELLAKELGEAGRQMHVEAHANGLVTVSGPVGSVEEKVAVSRLFRQLPGCSGVVNQLNLEPVLRDGQRLVQVTKDGSQMVPMAALGSLASRPATATPSMLHARRDDLRLPSPGAPRTADARPASSPTGHGADTTIQPVKASKPDTSDTRAEPAASGVGPKSGTADVLTAPKPPARWEKTTEPRPSGSGGNPRSLTVAAPTTEPRPLGSGHNRSLTVAAPTGDRPAMTWESQMRTKPVTAPAATPPMETKPVVKAPDVPRPAPIPPPAIPVAAKPTVAPPSTVRSMDAPETATTPGPSRALPPMASLTPPPPDPQPAVPPTNSAFAAPTPPRQVMAPDDTS